MVRSAGFTLIELLVVISIIALLAGVLLLNFAGTSATGRDTKRQADIRLLQNAIELYKSKYGRYPEGCNGPGVWSGQIGSSFACGSGSAQYIVNLSPEFIRTLPVDPRPVSDDQGFVYTVNSDGTVYKLMAMNVVESEIVDYFHEFASCSVGPISPTTLPANAVDGFERGGWCSGTRNSSIWSTYGQTDSNVVPQCRLSSDFGNGRFDRSYGVWGGFDPVTIRKLEREVTFAQCPGGVDLVFDRRSLAGIVSGSPVTTNRPCRAWLAEDTANIICR